MRFALIESTFIVIPCYIELSCVVEVGTVMNVHCGAGQE